MEELQEAREELAAVEKELNMKSSRAREQGGAELIRGDQVFNRRNRGMCFNFQCQTLIQ